MSFAAENRFVARLTPSTAELIEKYATFDTEAAYLVSFNIINEELIGIINRAGEWLKEGFVANEVLSEVWEAENPCSECPERKGCNITCRRKHAFDKEIYGGLLCGKQCAAIQKAWGDNEEENKVHFKVRFTPYGELIFERDRDYAKGGIKISREGTISIFLEEINLRPWSAALYAMFVSHPEGFELCKLTGELKSELIKRYKTITQSEVKVKRLRSQLRQEGSLSHLLNNKLSELNTQLRSAGVAEVFLVGAEAHKSNNKPYFIPYLKCEK